MIVAEYLLLQFGEMAIMSKHHDIYAESGHIISPLAPPRTPSNALEQKEVFSAQLLHNIRQPSRLRTRLVATFALSVVILLWLVVSKLCFS